MYINQTNDDLYKNSLLQIGVQTNNIKLVKFLLDKGSDLEYKNKLNENIYDIVIQRNNYSLLKIIYDFEQKNLKDKIKELDSTVKYYEKLYISELNKKFFKKN